MNKKLRILCTGHKGYIGSRLFSTAKDSVHEFIGIDKKEGQDILKWLPNGKNIDIVIHLAAQTGAIPSMEDPIYDAENNIIATLKIIQKYKNKKIIFATSGAAIEAKSPYGLSKRTCEDYIKMLCKDYVICRLSSIYGDKDRGVVDDFLRQDKIKIYGDGSAERDFVYVDDIVEMFNKARYWKTGEYSCGTGKGVKIIDIAKAVNKPIEFLPERDGEIKKAVLPNTTPNWKPKINVFDFIKSRIEE